MQPGEYMFIFQYLGHELIEQIDAQDAVRRV